MTNGARSLSPVITASTAVFSLTYRPMKKVPVRDYLQPQGRFSHLTDGEFEEIQRVTDEEWESWEEMDRRKRIILPCTKAPSPIGFQSGLSALGACSAALPSGCCGLQQFPRALVWARIYFGELGT